MENKFPHDTNFVLPATSSGLLQPNLTDVSLSGIPLRGDPQFFDYCFKLCTGGRSHEALELLYDAWEADPDDCAAGHVLTMALMMIGDRKAALAESDKVLSRFPYFVPGYCQRAQILLSLRRRREALAAARTAVRLSPKDFESLDLLANCLLANGRGPEARAVAEQMLDIEPFQPRTQELLGSASLMMGENQEAVERFRRALVFDPDSVQAVNDLGVALQRSGRDKDAVDVFYAASKMPRNVSAGERLFASVERYVSRTIYRTVIVLLVLSKLMEYGPGVIHDAFAGPGSLLFFALIITCGLSLKNRRLRQLSPEIIEAYDRARILLNARSAKYVWPFGAFLASVGGWAMANALVQARYTIGMELPEGIAFVVLIMGITFIGLCWWSVEQGKRLALN